jgi:large subunit ribosomal protein L18
LERRRRRIRRTVVGTAERPRLLVHTTLAHCYAQVIDDATGKVLAAANTLQTSVRSGLKSTGNIAAAKSVGRQIAAAAQSQGVKKVCFDRGGRKYHGRVKALADAAREAGLVF